MGYDIKVENANFSQNTITFHFIVADVSGSMQGEKEKSVRKGFKLIQDELIKLEDTSSTRVSVIKFGSNIYPDDLKCVESFDVNYRATGEGTALYAAICYVKEQIQRLYSIYRDKYRLNLNVIFLSDGENWSQRSSESAAKNAVAQLKTLYKASTIFYAIEEKYKVEHVTKIARELGFDVKRVDGDQKSIENMSRQLSTMLVSSSRSGIPAELNGLSATLSSTVSRVAAEKFEADMAGLEEVILDPFEDLM